MPIPIPLSGQQVGGSVDPTSTTTSLRFYLIDSSSSFPSPAYFTEMVRLPGTVTWDGQLYTILAAIVTVDQHLAMSVIEAQPQGWDGTVANARQALRQSNLIHLWYVFDAFLRRLEATQSSEPSRYLANPNRPFIRIIVPLASGNGNPDTAGVVPNAYTDLQTFWNTGDTNPGPVPQTWSPANCYAAGFRYFMMLWPMGRVLNTTLGDPVDGDFCPGRYPDGYAGAAGLRVSIEVNCLSTAREIVTGESEPDPLTAYVPQFRELFDGLIADQGLGRPLIYTGPTPLYESPFSTVDIDWITDLDAYWAVDAAAVIMPRQAEQKVWAHPADFDHVNQRGETCLWWVEASSDVNAGAPVNGATVTSLGDQSYNGDDPTCNGGVTYRSTDGPSGNPCLRFNGTNAFLEFPATSLGDFTAVCVFKDGTPAYAERLIDHSYITGFWVGRNPAAVDDSFGGGIRQPGAPYGNYAAATDGEWHVIELSREGTGTATVTQTLRIDGQVVFSGPCDETATTSAAVRIGCAIGGTDFTNADIFCAGLFARSLSVNERNLLMRYLERETGLSITGAADALLPAQEMIRTFVDRTGYPSVMYEAWDKNIADFDYFYETVGREQQKLLGITALTNRHLTGFNDPPGTLWARADDIVLTPGAETAAWGPTSIATLGDGTYKPYACVIIQNTGPATVASRRAAVIWWLEYFATHGNGLGEVQIDPGGFSVADLEQLFADEQAFAATYQPP